MKMDKKIEEEPRDFLNLDEVKNALIKQRIFEKRISNEEKPELADIVLKRVDEPSKRSTSYLYSVEFIPKNGQPVQAMLKQAKGLIPSRLTAIDDKLKLQLSKTNFESRVYELFGRAGVGCLTLELYDHLHNPDALLFGFYGQDVSDLFRNTLEDELVRIDDDIYDAKKISKNGNGKVKTLIQERHNLLLQVAKNLAKMHYRLTRHVHYPLDCSGKTTPILVNGVYGYPLKDNDGIDWAIPIQTVDGIQKRVVRNTNSILNYLYQNQKNQKNKLLFKSDREFREYMNKLKKIFNDGKDFLFKWVEVERPEQGFVTHGDLHGRQILLGSKQKNEERELKIIDFKNVSYGSPITDFGFLQSYVYNTDDRERRAIFQTYFDEIRKLADNDRVPLIYARELADKVNIATFDTMDLTRQVSGNLIIAGNICDYPRLRGFTEQLRDYLRYTRKSLEVLADHETMVSNDEHAVKLKDHLADKIGEWLRR